MNYYFSPGMNVLKELLSDTVPAPALSPDVERILDTAFWIRAFESSLLNLFKQGLLAGTVHTCIGQELCAAALHPHLVPGKDAFFASHRGHGHYLAHSGPADALLAELAGREGALCLGRGGTQNLLYQRFFSAGIQGGSAPIAVGYAWAARRRGENAIAVAQLGDGTLGEGTVYEAFTFAAWLGAPVLFLLEHNGWAQSTDVTTTTPGDIFQRAAGFGLEADYCDDRDPSLLYERLGRAVAVVRRGQPFLQVIQTRRLMAHSKGDDNRPQEYVASLWRADPLARLAERDDAWQQRQADAEARARQLAQEIADRPLLEEIIAEALPNSEITRTDADLRSDGPGAGKWERTAEELNAALHEILAENPDVVLVGEDLLDPYGGAFKVARGLSTRFPNQVLSTPIAEAGLTGLANGMALAGMRPIAEIMFADFATLAADQLINFAAKYYFMYGGRVTCPITVRLVSGGGRGYGPTHSQSLERLFCGIPGLRVVALSQRHHPGRLLRQVVLSSDSPTIFVENKLLYSLRPCDHSPIDLEPALSVRTEGSYPPLCYRPLGGQKADCTIVTYGGMTVPTEAAMHQMLLEREFSFDYIVLTQLWPLDVSEVVASVRQTRRLIVVEENVPEFSVGSAVLAAVAQQVPEGFACRAVGSRPVPLPSVRRLEERVLPSAAAVVQAIEEIV